MQDDSDTRKLTCLVLETEGFEVVCPESPRDFLNLAKEEQFDLYLVDTRMPEVSGIELCRSIREFDSHIPIIFYSAAAFERDRAHAIACGAQAYIVKPGNFEELANRIRSGPKA
jgi:DNA-binding response OmpR family regulator